VTGDGLYEDPLVYDVLHAPGSREEIDGLEAIERRFVPPTTPRRWLEPACGSGRYLREAAGRGIDVVGFDLNPAMVEFARAHAPRPGGGVGRSEYLAADMTDFALPGPPFSMAFNLINTIRHLPSDGAMLAHLERIARVLAPGGIYVVGLSLSAYGCEGPSEDVWTGRRGSLAVHQVVQYLPPRTPENPRPRREVVVSHLTVRRPGGVEHRDSTYTLRTYSASQWVGLIGRSALKLLETVDEQGEPVSVGDGGYALFVLGR
jgi:SAM-dependent methyltransferase